MKLFNVPETLELVIAENYSKVFDSIFIPSKLSVAEWIYINLE